QKPQGQAPQQATHAPRQSPEARALEGSAPPELPQRASPRPPRRCLLHASPATPRPPEGSPAASTPPPQSGAPNNPPSSRRRPNAGWRSRPASPNGRSPSH